MAEDNSGRIDLLWSEYSLFLRDWDDITLSRWLAQILSQLQGAVWRQSHPLVGSFRLGAVESKRRNLRVSRWTQIPHGYQAADCCGAPLLPLVNRNTAEEGLLCIFCDRPAMTFEQLPGELQPALKEWAERYHPVHEVAHWTEEQKLRCGDYDKAYNDAAAAAEELLQELHSRILLDWAEAFGAVAWEDADECLDVRPDDLVEEV